MATIIEIGASVGSCLGAFNHLRNLVKALAAVDDRVKRNEIVLEIQEELIKEQAAHLDEIEKRKAAVERTEALEEKLLEAEDFAREAQLYEPLSPCSGITVYRRAATPKEGDNGGWYCPCCFEKKKLRLLQADAELNPRGAGGLDIGFKCHECGFSFFMLRRVAQTLLR